MGFIRFLLAFAILVAPISIVAEDSVPPEAVSKMPENVVFLLGRAIDASLNSDDKWMAAVIEAVMEFKLAAIDGITLISPDSVGKYVSSHSNLAKVPSESDYMTAAKRLKANYIGIQNFEISPKDKSVFYYMEIVSVKQGKIQTTIERNFKLSSLGVELDEILALLMKEFKLATPRELARFVKLPAIVEDYKVLKQFGSSVIAERFSKGSDPAKTADEYRKVCEKNRGLLVGYYRAGVFFEAMGKNSDAAEAFNLLFLTIPEYTPIYVPLCRNFRKARRYEDAVRVAMLGEKRKMKDSELISEMALAYEGMGKTEDAEKAYKQILTIDPDDPYALLFYARTSNNAGNAKQGLEYAQRLIKQKKELGKAYLEYGRSLMLLSKSEEAIKALSDAKSHLAGDPEPSIYLGDIYVSNGNFSKAVQQYEQVLKKAPDNVDLYLKAAGASEKAGDSKKALSILKEIGKRFSNHGGLQRELGVLSLINGDTASAKVHLEASMRAKTEDDRVLMGLGWIYFGSGDIDKAFTMFSRALSMVKDKSKCKLGLALVYIKRGETGSALSLLQEVSAEDLKVPDVNRMLGDAFLTKGEKAKALTYYKKELTISKPDTSIQGKIAFLSYETASSQEAHSEYQKLEKMGGGGSTALYRLVILSLRLKDKPGAQNYYARAKKAGSADGETYYQIGSEYSGLGATEQSIDAYQECVKKEPSRDSVWVELVGLYKKTGKDSAAAEAQLKLFSINNEKYKSNLAEAGRLFEKCGLKSRAKEVYTTFLGKKYVDHEVNLSLSKIEFEGKNYTSVIKLLEGLPPSRINLSEAQMLAESYSKTNQHAKAIPHLSFVLKKNPKDHKAIEASAIAYEKQNDIGQAISMYQKYLAIAGKHQEYSYHLAQLMEKQNLTKEATAQYASNTKTYPDDFRNFDRLGRIYFSMKYYKNAVGVLEKALRFKEASVELQGLLAKAQVEVGDKNAAIANYRVYLEKSPKDSTGWFDLGKLYLEQKNYSDACNALEKASVLMSRNFELLKLLGNSYIQAGDLSKAINPLQKARDLNKSDLEVADLLAKCYRETKATKHLTDLLSSWAQVDKKNYEIRKELADLLIAQSKPADAANVLEDAAKLKKCDEDIHNRLAQIYEKLGNNERWFSHLRSASSCAPKSAEPYYHIARYFYLQKEYDKAEDYLNKAVTYSPNHGPANYMLGVCLGLQNKYKESVKYLIASVKAESENSDYRIALTEALYRTGNNEQALKAIRPVLMREKAKPEVLRWAGLLYKATGRADTAKQILEDAISANKSCSECYMALGDLYFDEVNYRDAAKNFQIAIDQSGYNENAAVRLAQSYNRLGKADQAKKIYEMILTNSPSNGEALYRLCHLHIQNGNLDYAKEIMAKNTSNKHGWFFLTDGEISEADGNLRASMIAYSKALKMLPEVPDVQAACGRISLARRKYSAAIRYFGVAMGGDPDNVQLVLDLGKAYEGTKDYSTAMELYQEVLRQKSSHPEVHYCIARVASKSNDHQKAIQMLKDGIRYNKKNETLYLALGHEYRITKRDDDALEAYFRAVKADEEQCKEAYKYIGNIYYLKKDEKKAKKFYEMYINVGGKDSRVKKLLNRLN